MDRVSVHDARASLNLNPFSRTALKVALARDEFVLSASPFLSQIVSTS